MKLTLPKSRSALKLVFTDIDGNRYYKDSENEIVDRHGELVSLTTESNIRAILKLRESVKRL